MKRGLQGRYETVSTAGEKVQAFVPHPLPPVPAIEFTPALRKKFDDALLALGKLDSVSALLPDVGLFLYMFVRKEAVLSSMIEGTQSSLADLLMYESQVAPGVPLDDVEEVCNYVAAMNHGLARMRDGFPLSLRLVREMHAQLLSKGRGAAKTPGEFRHSQNWIGGSRPGNAAFFCPKSGSRPRFCWSPTPPIAQPPQARWNSSPLSTAIAPAGPLAPPFTAATATWSTWSGPTATPPRRATPTPMTSASAVTSTAKAPIC